MLAQYMLSSCVCLSVFLSVTCQYSIKMAKLRIMQTTPHVGQVFWQQISWRHSDGVNPNGGNNIRAQVQSWRWRRLLSTNNSFYSYGEWSDLTKVAYLDLPHLHLSPLLGVTSSHCHQDLWCQKNIESLGFMVLFPWSALFLQRNAMLARYMPLQCVSVPGCVSVSLSHSGIVSKWLNVESYQ